MGTDGASRTDRSRASACATQYGLDWAAFSAALAATPPGNGGAMMLPWFDAGDHAARADARRSTRRRSSPTTRRANVRAVVEAQMMAMANHSRWMGVAIVDDDLTRPAARPAIATSCR